jgi:glycosyltransferase involved in cell wall biosynthesis
MKPTISIVTVCLNARQALVKTKASVFSQCFKDFEWIVIDGASVDGTVEDLKVIEDARLSYSSEPDAGIYDAMNKGLTMARGEWVWFLNAGDCFHDETALEQVVAVDASVDICFGEAMMVTEQGRVLGLRSEVLPHQCPAELSKADFKRGMLVSHQAFVLRRAIALKYDLKYSLSSDLDWMLRILEKAPSSHRLGVLATVVREGATSRNWKRSQLERFQILAKHFGLLSTVWQHFRIVARRIVHKARIRF